MQYNAKQCNRMQYNKIQYSTIQYKTTMMVYTMYYSCYNISIYHIISYIMNMCVYICIIYTYIVCVCLRHTLDSWPCRGRHKFMSWFWLLWHHIHGVERHIVASKVRCLGLALGPKSAQAPGRERTNNEKNATRDLRDALFVWWQSPKTCACWKSSQPTPPTVNPKLNVRPWSPDDSCHAIFDS